MIDIYFWLDRVSDVDTAFTSVRFMFAEDFVERVVWSQGFPSVICYNRYNCKQYKL